RRDPPPRPRGRGDALPGDGGRRAAGRARPGRGRAHRHPAAAALHADRRDHFGLSHRLEHYSPEHLALIVERSAGILDVEIDSEGAYTIASRSRGTPRVANRLLK